MSLWLIFDRAPEADSEFFSALAGLSDVLSYEVLHSFTDVPEAQAERAVQFVRRTVEIEDEDPIARVSLGRASRVSALGHLGRRTEANRALEELLQLKPGLTIGWFRSRPYFVDMASDVMDDTLDGLRKAGLAE